MVSPLKVKVMIFVSLNHGETTIIVFPFKGGAMSFD